MIAILDYGIGNIGSIANMLNKIGYKDICFAKTAQELSQADKIILPGVGAFDTGMKLLNDSGMRDELDNQVVKNGKPILGICLGMQMLGLRSEEGESDGLGYIDFVCKRFPEEILTKGLRIPHMGWDYICTSKNDVIANDFYDDMKFYFVHSYYAICNDDTNVLFKCDYGFEFAAGVSKSNIYGVQFHPEKSHKFGMKLLENFVRI